MRDEWISQYIDDELALKEKIGFVKAVRGSADFYSETLALLDQETLLRLPLTDESAIPDMPEMTPSVRRWHRWAVPLAAAAILIAAVVLTVRRPIPPVQAAAPIPYRFVIHHPTASAVAISGSFTKWQRISLKPSGDTGYWEIVLPLPRGEHRFSYIIGGAERMPDPTIPAREPDDFGGVNTVLEL